MEYVPQDKNAFIRVRATKGTDIVHMIVEPNTSPERIVTTAMGFSDLLGDFEIELLDFDFAMFLVCDKTFNHTGTKVFVSDGTYL